MPSLDPDALVDWIRLIRSDGVGPATFRQLLARFGSAGEALHHLPTFNARRKTPFKLCSLAQAETELRNAQRLGLTCVTSMDAAYPAALAAIDDAPPLLWVKGDAGLLARPSIAVVGARNASVNGRKLAATLSAGLAEAGLVVVSGMARGIDGAAHEAVLRANGATVAVLAGGTDVIYPPEHKDLYARIAGQGAAVSEMPPGAEPVAAAFPRRNRIISGLSLGVVVVEAALRSGSLITARLAAEQGRDVFAVPGSPLDPRASGPNNLIREGAVLVENAQDILSVMGPASHFSSVSADAVASARKPIENADKSPPSDLLQLVEKALGPSPTAVDEVVRQCQVSPALVATALLELELAGRIERHPGNRVALIGTD
jgi:DNA processing protein